ncbi:AMP-binding enzyme [Lysobacter enzymogenes]|uniref:AMP-binding enzyme n=1 Tax=Lysobacter enzymogenes TaxID=69 RepID=A0A0S2DFD4_LYSEN|nr:fatty acyl-AMP ligase [Lysobacter enzymogenes]ALN57203.1 AMP-binding enzyme [Lysobacter enzymogenes]QCW25858.1 long-chain fatty acid--CoA ligase [Lysobacter enzymogenes]
MSRFTHDVFVAAPASGKGLVTGEPHRPVRRTWQEIHGIARRMAGALAAAGVNPGDAVGVLMGEPAGIAPTIQAIWMRGASVTMLHQPGPRADLDAWAEDTFAVLDMIGAKLVVVGDVFLRTMPLFEAKAAPVVSADALAEGAALEPVECGEDDIAFLQLTSGSTGLPKAVAISHRNLHENAAAMVSASKLDPRDDVLVSWLPLFHDMGMIGFLVLPMQVGAEAVCAAPGEFLRSPRLWPSLIAKYRGTMTAGPNFAYALLARYLRAAADGAFDLSSLRFALSGAEPVDHATVAAVLETGARFGLDSTAFVAAYGMAEATLAISFSETGAGVQFDAVDQAVIERESHAAISADQAARRLAKLGKPVPGIEIRVGDGDSAKVRTVGELKIRGDAVSRYYLTPSGKRSLLGDDGWFSTGDMGYVTETGEVVVCGRLKDMIIVAGRNIFPGDIERAACRVDGVRQGNAIAVALAAAGIREEFAVVVEAGDSADSESSARIKSDVSDAVYAAFGVSPRLVSVVPPRSLPKTPSGKPKRSATIAIVETELAMLHGANSQRQQESVGSP